MFLSPSSRPERLELSEIRTLVALLHFFARNKIEAVIPYTKNFIKLIKGVKNSKNP